MKFTIDYLTPSQNPWDRMHWAARRKIKEDLFWLVKGTIGVTQPHKEPKTVSIVRVAERLIDDANVASGCKYLVDALQVFGHIWRDSRQWARVTFDQRKCKKGEAPHMEIEITPLAQQSP